MRPRASRPSASPSISSSASTALPARRAIARAAREVLQRDRELAAEELRPAEEQQHLQPGAELLVGQSGDQRRGLAPARARLVELAERVRGHRQRGGRRGHGHRVRRTRQRLRRAHPHLQRVPAQRRVRGQLEVERDRVARSRRRRARRAAAARAPSWSPSSRSITAHPTIRSIRPARPPAAGRAARAGRGGRRRSGPLPPAHPRAGRAARASSGPRTSVRATVSQCTAVCGARPVDLGRRFGEQRDGRDVARRSRLLDVVGERDRAGARALEAGRGARVPDQPAPRAHRLVDGAAHDRVAEAEAPHVVGDAARGPPPRARPAPPARRPASSPATSAAKSISNGSPTIAAPSSSARASAASGVVSLSTASRTASGTSPCPGSLARATAGRSRAGELHQVERVPAALLVQAAQLAVVGGAGEQPRGLGGGQRPGRQPAGAPGIGGAAQLGVQRGVGLTVAVGDRQQQPRRGRAADERGDERDRRRVGPVQVVEQQHEAARRGQPLEQRADRAVQLVALRGRPGVRVQRRERAAQRGELRFAQAGRRAVRGQVAVQRLDQQRVGDVALVLRAASAQDQRTGPASPDAPRCSSRVVLPIPASPTISITERRLVRTASSSTATSPDRPMSGMPLSAGVGCVTVRDGMLRRVTSSASWPARAW